MIKNEGIRHCRYLKKPTAAKFFANISPELLDLLDLSPVGPTEETKMISWQDYNDSEEMTVTLTEGDEISDEDENTMYFNGDKLDEFFGPDFENESFRKQKLLDISTTAVYTSIGTVLNVLILLVLCSGMSQDLT